MNLENLVLEFDVPQSAARKLEELWQDNPGHDQRTLIDRLANDLAMKTIVWPKLPKTPYDLEGDLIAAAFDYGQKGFGRYYLQKQPLPYCPTMLDGMIRSRQLPYVEISERAACVRDAMLESFADTNRTWPNFWKSKIVPDFQTAVELLRDISEAYAELDRQWRACLGCLPRIRKRNASNLDEQVFVPMIGLELQQLYGRPPNHEVVAGLTQVVFDLKDGVGYETVRSRWRDYLNDQPEFRLEASRPTISRCELLKQKPAYQKLGP